ncbi:tol-pal system-associated acyl-CoA thioesterase [Caviibacterium pharyngocola]|uniref:Tol-pal system-associated acyl-CoA thioesterase n=1 Tax=Caviibacterium pharyngocola TaxID=28159 RepID=A0A2M8RX67_9PAST|nr:tol-pal system-associated acyl-CoA thioesterase [Caviibacterium pharyngocola]PJG83478.1 tol-pal system-associated acyl-CoA thioesterase [Caviibacterium pharyngocola]
MINFSFPIRVYYEDTDAGGVVYHARYLHFFERARTEYLRNLSFSQQTLLAEHNLAFVVKSMQIDYRFPAKLDDLLIVETALSELKGATVLFTQTLKRNETVLCEAVVKVACVNLNKMKPVAIPADIKAAFQAN